jgi:FixJ family two-component response regulator
MVRNLSRKSPRPHVILLSPNADANLWDELERVGGSDILRTPINRDKMLRAVKRAWLLWRNQQQVRMPLQHRV